MSTQAQRCANQANAQHSTGPKSEEGKAISSQNNFRHGFTGAFCILAWENAAEYEFLYNGLLDEHSPATTTEHILVKTMAQSHWLRERALTLQQRCFDPAQPLCEAGFEKQLALYLRYQTTHDRAFTKALDQLTKLRADTRKQQIGFESQKRKREENVRKEAEQNLLAERRAAREKRHEAAEQRAQEIHEARVWLIGAQARRHETETTIAKFFKMPRNPEATPELAAKTAA